MIRRLFIGIFTRLIRAALLRVAEDLEAMQAIQAGLSSAAFANEKLRGSIAVHDRDTLLRNALERVACDGLICEFGVYKGHTLRIIADTVNGGLVYGFDSFQGLPEAWRAGFDKGAFNVEDKELPSRPCKTLTDLMNAGISS